MQSKKFYGILIISPFAIEYLEHGFYTIKTCPTVASFSSLESVSK